MQCTYPALLVGNKQLKELSIAQEYKKIPVIFGIGPVYWATGEPGLRSICLFCLRVTL